MQDEVMKAFIEQILCGLDGVMNALDILLEQYHINIAESEMETSFKEAVITQEDIRKLFEEKIKEGKTEEIRNLLTMFDAQKISDIKVEDYEKVYFAVKQI